MKVPRGWVSVACAGTVVMVAYQTHPRVPAAWHPLRGSYSHGLLTLASLGLAASDPLQTGKPCFPK